MGKLNMSGKFFCCLIEDHPKGLDMKLSQVEFAHNHATNRRIGLSLFQVVYSALPYGPLDLIPLLVKTQIQVKANDFVTCLRDIIRPCL